jgi:ubiquinone/menaquinone biosynthesis C-methylase UbiE
MDWGLGRYEQIALQLLPASSAAVAEGRPQNGERVIDIGCGSGNATLLAAQCGARVIGIDPAKRLLEVAAARARERGLEVSFLAGEAASLPLPDSAADLVLSVFGVMFASDPGAVAAEIARVSSVAGRVVLCAWIPTGALAEMMGLRREAIAALGAGAPAPAPFAWHDATALAELLAPLGFRIEAREEQLALRAASARDFLEAELRDHPLWIAARAMLEPAAEMPGLYQRALGILEAANEDSGGFRISSPYLLARAQRL